MTDEEWDTFVKPIVDLMGEAIHGEEMEVSLRVAEDADVFATQVHYLVSLGADLDTVYMLVSERDKHLREEEQWLVMRPAHSAGA